MDFEKRKQRALKGLDKSKKGSIDAKIKKLVDLINSLDDYYTSSSCSGRTLILDLPAKGRKKDEARWLYVSHSRADHKKIISSLKKAERHAWLKYEPVILHICCRSLESAEKMLRICRQAGMKKAGIISTQKTVIETFGTENIEAPIAGKSSLLVRKSYLKALIAEANKKHKRNIKAIEKLYRALCTLA
ncbi:hypothetical protein GF323_02740 [Candidatus Woesearchaeota archaeon]|nr:hypothetical protein [Candidatus Woesearchaeota archaeon]